jgi:hypothetical protein
MKRISFILKSGLFLFVLALFLLEINQILSLRSSIQEIQLKQIEKNKYFYEKEIKKSSIPFREGKVLCQEEAISIALNDFKSTHSIQDYQAFAVETNVIWKVIIERKGKPKVGGSAEYNIDKNHGDIYSKKFSQ